jgi:hypothetical protein
VFTTAAIVLATLAGGAVLAQSDTDSITVTAANLGVFEFNITDATFDFGDVDADGTLSSGGVSGARNGANDGAVYDASAATSWTCRSAPPRTVRVYNASTTATINWGVADRLRVRVPTTGLPGSTSCGFVDFSVTGDGSSACNNGELVHSVSVGNGGNAVTGSVDFELDVLDVDDPGSNSWTVVLTATGT